jgi:hypothetical protein
VAKPRRTVRVVGTTAPYCPPGTLSNHSHTQCPIGASEGDPVVRWCPAVRPLCEDTVDCEVGLSSYGAHFPFVRAARLVDGRSTMQVPG